ncbi:hypothetical protein [Microlunatus soli]|uniref:hypothetical protein n=1 Tax=Microlunatus soli TaxID=630515 RepID=UPI0018D3F8EF|nr:hypothetical protein [Microlunatus soli]
MSAYTLCEGLLDTVITPMRAVEVKTQDGRRIGHVVRGDVADCERTGTFRFEPTSGPSTSMGIVGATARTILHRLLRPSYILLHERQRWTLHDLPGENLLYFAVAGTVQARRLVARLDWDDSVQITADGAEVGRVDPGDLLLDTRLRADDDLDPPLFGLIMLIPFIYRVYEQEAELIESLLD